MTLEDLFELRTRFHLLLTELSELTDHKDLTNGGVLIDRAIYRLIQEKCEEEMR